jgi:Fe-S-cluster containining protein
MNAKAPQPIPKNKDGSIRRPVPPSPPPPPKRSSGPDILAGFEFKCNRCGRCCGLVPFTRSDYKRVRRKAEKLRIPFVKKEIEGRITYLVKRIIEKIGQAGDIGKVNPKDIICPFLEFDKADKASCKIYDDRPEICRMFGTEGWKGVYLCCPYQNINISTVRNENI